ncbi:MAG: hypothetical protein R2788_05430 [Saprospiraceae bacterium]
MGENDTVSTSVPVQYHNGRATPGMPIQVEKVQIPVEDIQTTEEEIGWKLKTSAILLLFFPTLTAVLSFAGTTRCWFQQRRG